MLRIGDNIIYDIGLESARDAARRIAERVRRSRLHRGWSQEELASRAGVALPTYRVFERTGNISLERLLRIASVLDSRRGFEELFALPTAGSIAELEARSEARTRKRGRTGA